MIAWLEGRVIDYQLSGTTAELVVATGGVGYRVVVSGDALRQVRLNEPVTLHVHHHFWEADQRLFGFATKDERIAFVGLLAAHKVGPALALAIISTYRPAELATILATDDLDALCAVPGVGKKTAQRLLVDLRSSLVLPVLEGDGGAGPAGTEPTAGSAVLIDVREALSSLGYGTDEIRQAVAEVAADADSVESGELLKRALRSLAKGT